MHRALYRKWRPRDFDDVCGQTQVTDVLKYEVESGKTSHAYLFCGSRGTGKTSCAKILAKAVNCESPVGGNPCNRCAACRSIEDGTATDVIEMDAASNTGVENVRDIKEEIVFSPASLRYRVYIIDEVHMMSQGAFNALLKTLEEPPAHVLFILATTELHKLPATIVSRCQRFEFRRLTTSVIVDRLMQIAEAEGIDLDPSGARLLATLAQGGMRDAVSLLELCAGMKCRIDAALVSSELGAGNRNAAIRIAQAVALKDYDAMYREIAEIVSVGGDLTVFFRELCDLWRDLTVIKMSSTPQEYLDLTDGEYESLCAISSGWTFEMLIYQSKLLTDAIMTMQRPGISKRSTAELTLTRMCDYRMSVTPDGLNARIAQLEEAVSALKMEGGAVRSSSAETAEHPHENEGHPAAPAEQKPTAAPMPAATPITAAERVSYRRVPGWHEVVERFAALKPSLYAILIDVKAYSDGSGLYLLCVKNQFALSRVCKEEVLSDIRRMLAEEEGRLVDDIHLEVRTAADSGEYHIFDEIEEALHE